MKAVAQTKTQPKFQLIRFGLNGDTGLKVMSCKSLQDEYAFDSAAYMQWRTGKAHRA